MIYVLCDENKKMSVYERAMMEIRAQERKPKGCDHEFVKIHSGSYIRCVKCNEQRGPFPTDMMRFGDYERVQFRTRKSDMTKKVFCEMLLSFRFQL